MNSSTGPGIIVGADHGDCRHFRHGQVGLSAGGVDDFALAPVHLAGCLDCEYLPSGGGVGGGDDDVGGGATYDGRDLSAEQPGGFTFVTAESVGRGSQWTDACHRGSLEDVDQ